MSEDIINIIKPSEELYGGVKLRKPTAGTLSLCDFAKLRITQGGQSNVPFFEAIAFFYIHANKIDVVRGVLFDLSHGKDDEGRSISFVNAVVEWADNVELGTITQMGDKIGEMLADAMGAKVEPAEDNKDSSIEVEAVVSDAKKKEEVAPQPS